MKVILASNGYITDDNGDLYVYTEHDVHKMHKDILHDLEKALIEHGEVEVEVKITPYKRNEDLLNGNLISQREIELLTETRDEPF